MKGLFVTFEGIEGAGKSTIVSALAKALIEESFDVITTREPGATTLGSSLRPLLLQNQLTPQTEALLFAADRADHVAKVINPSLEKDQIVLCDRFETSSIVYQGIWRNLGVESIKQISRFASNNLVPDLVIWCKIDPARAALRRTEHPDALDKAATQAAEFLDKAFEEQAKSDPERFLIVNSDQPVELIVSQIIERVKSDYLTRAFKTRNLKPLKHQASKGRLVLLAGPSGSGKNTVLERLLEQPGRWYSVSATTRSPRNGEVDGIHYKFISEEDFNSIHSSQGFLESAKYANFMYGTPAKEIEEHLSTGDDVFCIIELEGVKQILKRYPDAITIFLAPPSIEELQSRLRERDAEATDQLPARLKAAVGELELGPTLCDYVIYNQDLEKTVASIERILERNR